MYTIYLRTNKVTGIQYVGQTKNFKRRERDWKRFDEIYGNNYLTEEREKYGLENFNVVVIDHCETREEAWELEQFYIKELNTKYPDGYNMSDGGVGTKGIVVTEKTREKQRNKKLGKHHSEETKRKMSEAHKGENCHWYGKHFSEEHKRKLSDAKKGIKYSEKHREKIADGHKKPILQIDKTTGEVIREWKSATDVNKELGLNKSHITACCKGKLKSVGGYIWKYKNEGN